MENEDGRYRFEEILENARMTPQEWIDFLQAWAAMTNSTAWSQMMGNPPEDS